MKKTETRFRYLWRVVLGLGLSGLTIYLALRDIDFQQSGEIFKQVNLTFVYFALAGVASGHLVKALRWRILLGSSGPKTSLLQLFGALSISQMLNLIVPVRVGEISRIVLLGKLGLSRSFVLGTIVLEKYLDLFSFALWFSILLFWVPLPGWVNESGYALLLVTLFGGIVLLGVWVWRNRLFGSKGGFSTLLGRLNRHFPAQWQSGVLFQRLERWMRSGVASLEIMRSRANLLQLFLCSVVIWGAAILTNQMAMMALNLDLPLSAPVLLMVALQAVFTVPSAPGKLGIFEYICILVLEIYGVNRLTALSYGILLHGIAYLPVIGAGLVFLWLSGMVSTWADLFHVEER
jgi:uncharacterized protein (TIRG00374 family)